MVRELFGRTIPLILLLFILILGSFVQAQIPTPSGITYHGKILRSDNSPLNTSNAVFKIEIRSPGSENCLLWQEEQTVDMSATNGVFVLNITDTSASGYSRTDGYAWDKNRVFSNRTGFTGLTDCDLGATAYSPSANDGRTIKVSFKESPAVAAWEDIQISKLNYVPMSLNSQQLAGFSATEFLKIEPGASQTPLTIAQVNTLLQIIAGTTTIFVKPGDTAAGDLSGTFAAPVVDGLQGVPVLATAPTPNQVLKFNGTAWAPATESMPGDASYAAKGAVQFLTDQATSGIQVAAGVASLPSLFAQGSSVGGAQQIPVITYDTKGRLTALAAAAVDDTTKLPLDGSDPMTGSLNMGNQNITNVNSVSTTSIGSRSLRLFDADNSNYVDLQTPSVVATNYALTLPADDGTAGQVLTTDGNGVLSWAANGSGITVDPNEAVIANATGTGLVSFFCPMNQVFSFDGMGIPTCQAVTPAGGFINNGNSFAANATLGLNDGFDLNIETSGVPRMTLTAAGNVGIGTTSPAGLFIVNGGTAAPASNGLGISLAAQNAGSGNQSGGSINLNTGSSTGTGSPGAIYLNPGSDSGLNPGIIMATGNLIVAPTNYRSGVDNSNLVTLNIQGLVNSSVTTYTGTFTSMYSFPRVAPSPGRTFNEVIGLYSRIGHIGFGNTTNFYNIYSANPSISTGTVQNAYGLYVEPITSGTTSNYSIYANGASPSYFGGNVGIGVTTPTRPLHVNGPMRITASTLPGTPAAGDIAVDSGDANKLKYYDGSAWQTAGGSGGGALPAAGGTAAAPGYAFTGDTNTGMFSSIADTVQFSTNSTERMRIDSSGNVCVGTSSPSGTLDVHKTSATSADSAVLAISHDDSSFVNYARTHLRLFTLRSNLNSSNFDGSTNKGWELTANSMSGGAGGSLGNLTLHWQGSGAWGVATETKATHMEVSPNGRFTFGAENAGTWTDSTVNVAGNLSVGQNYYTQPAPINGAIFEGNVGIGTASPVTKLDVNGEVKGNSFYSVGDISTDATLWAGGAILNGGGTAATPALVVGDGDGQAGIYGGASTLGLSTSGLSRIHITHTGNVGIGTTTPQAALDIASTGISSAIIAPRDTTSNRPTTLVNGMIRYNSTTNLFEFYQNGSWVNYTTVSDGRLKSNIEPITNGLDIINLLNPVYFDWDQKNPRAQGFGSQHQVGFIAQEVEKVLPEVVNKGEDSYRSVEYEKIVSVVVAAVKELYSQFIAVDKKVNQLEAENINLRKENAMIKAYLCSKDPAAPFCP